MHNPERFISENFIVYIKVISSVICGITADFIVAYDEARSERKWYLRINFQAN